MVSFLQKHGFKLAVLVLCAAMGTFLFYHYVINGNKKDPLPEYGVAPDFVLNDIKGNTFEYKGASDKVSLIYFYFANCPDVCPPTTFLLGKVQEQLAKEKKLGAKVEMISISFDPERDTPEVIEAFAKRMGADTSSWSFLYGETEKQMIQLARDYQIGVMKMPEDNRFEHFNQVVLVDKQGKIRDFISVDPEDDDAQTIKKIVEQVDRVL